MKIIKVFLDVDKDEQVICLPRKRRILSVTDRNWKMALWVEVENNPEETLPASENVTVISISNVDQHHDYGVASLEFVGTVIHNCGMTSHVFIKPS